MTLFTKRFLKRMGIFSALLYVLCDVLLKMYITGAEIDFETTAVSVYVAFLSFAFIEPFVIITLAIVFTRNLRLSSIMHFPKNEVRFYLIYCIVYSVIPIVYAIYIYNYSTAFYNAALEEAINGVYIRKYNEGYFNELCGKLQAVYDILRKAELRAIIIGCVIQAAMYALSVPKLLKVYRSPYKPPKRRI